MWCSTSTSVAVIQDPADLRAAKGLWRFAPGLVPGAPKEGLVSQLEGSPARLVDYDDSGWEVRNDLTLWHSGSDKDRPPMGCHCEMSSLRWRLLLLTPTIHPWYPQLIVGRDRLPSCRATDNFSCLASQKHR
jgi:hypothetical protein